MLEIKLNGTVIGPTGEHILIVDDDKREEVASRMGCAPVSVPVNELTVPITLRTAIETVIYTWQMRRPRAELGLRDSVHTALLVKALRDAKDKGEESVYLDKDEQAYWKAVFEVAVVPCFGVLNASAIFDAVFGKQ